MTFLRSIRADLLDKRLLPVVVVLAALAVLVPLGAGLLLGSGSSQPVIAPPPLPTPPPGTPSPASALAAVAGPAIPPPTRYAGRELDPFRPRGSAVVAQAAVPLPKLPATTASPSTVRVKSTTVAAAKPIVTTPVKPTTATPAKPTPAAPVTPTATPTPAPAQTTPVSTPSPNAQLAKLSRRDSYSVDVRVVDPTGVHNLTGLERLSPLPSSGNPLIEYLGVLKSRRAVAFLVNQGSVAQGPGRCLPRPVDCQVLVLKPGQVELLGLHTGGVGVAQAAIALTGWRVVTHPTVAAARKARAQEVKQGRTLVTQSAQPALGDLVYSVAQGAVSVVPAIVKALPGALTKLLGG